MKWNEMKKEKKKERKKERKKGKKKGKKGKKEKEGWKNPDLLEQISKSIFIVINEKKSENVKKKNEMMSDHVGDVESKSVFLGRMSDGGGVRSDDLLLLFVLFLAWILHDDLHQSDLQKSE